MSTTLRTSGLRTISFRATQSEMRLRIYLPFFKEKFGTVLPLNWNRGMYDEWRLIATVGSCLLSLRWLDPQVLRATCSPLHVRGVPSKERRTCSIEQSHSIEQVLQLFPRSHDTKSLCLYDCIFFWSRCVVNVGDVRSKHHTTGTATLTTISRRVRIRRSRSPQVENRRREERRRGNAGREKRCCRHFAIRYESFSRNRYNTC